MEQHRVAFLLTTDLHFHAKNLGTPKSFSAVPTRSVSFPNCATQRVARRVPCVPLANPSPPFPKWKRYRQSLAPSFPPTLSHRHVSTNSATQFANFREGGSKKATVCWLALPPGLARSTGSPAPRGGETLAVSTTESATGLYHPRTPSRILGCAPGTEDGFITCSHRSTQLSSTFGFSVEPVGPCSSWEEASTGFRGPKRRQPRRCGRGVSSHSSTASFSEGASARCGEQPGPSFGGSQRRAHNAKSVCYRGSELPTF